MTEKRRKAKKEHENDRIGNGLEEWTRVHLQGDT